MANKILVKSKVNAAANPAVEDATIAELAVNTFSGKLYIGTNIGVNGETDSTYLAGNNSAQVSWVGAPIDTTATLGTSDLKLATQNAIKTYVDAAEARAAQGLAVKTNVVGATTGAVVVTAATTAQTIIINDSDSFSSGGITWNASSQAFAIDGVTVTANGRILIKDNVTTGSSVDTLHSSNGIYTLPGTLVDGTCILTRAGDMDADGEFANAFVFVTGGAVNADTGWACTVDEGTQTFGIDAAGTPITFAQFNSAGTITAGAGLEKASGNTISIKGDSVTEAMLDCTDAPTNGYVLTAASGAGGGLNWSAAAAGDVTAVTAGTNIAVTNPNGPAPSVALATNVDVGGTLDVTGNTTLDGTLAVNGNAITYDAAASTLGVAAASGADTASGALTLNAGTGTGDEIGGAITLKTGGAVVDSSDTTPTVLVNALVLSATGGATFANTVAMGGALSGVTSLGMGGALSGVTTLGVSGLITCDDITAAADAITPGAGVSSTGGFNFTPGAVAEFGSGTHALLAGMTISPLAVTNGAGTTTTMATLHLDGVPTHTGSSFTNTYSLWCGGADGTTVDGRIGGAIISGGTF